MPMLWYVRYGAYGVWSLELWIESVLPGKGGYDVIDRLLVKTINLDAHFGQPTTDAKSKLLQGFAFGHS